MLYWEGYGDFPGGQVVRTGAPTAGGMCSVPDRGIKVPHPRWPWPKDKEMMMMWGKATEREREWERGLSNYPRIWSRLTSVVSKNVTPRIPTVLKQETQQPHCHETRLTTEALKTKNSGESLSWLKSQLYMWRVSDFCYNKLCLLLH